MSALAGVLLLGLLASAGEGAEKKPLGLGFQGELLVPVSDAFGPERDLGFGFAASLWAELPYVALQPRWSADFGPGTSGARYFNMAWELGVLVLPIRGPVTPMVGGGIALRYLSVTGQTDERTVGSVLRTTVTETPSRSGIGFGLLGRMGIIFFRGASVELLLSADYSVGFIEEQETAHALSFSLGITT